LHPQQKPWQNETEQKNFADEATFIAVHMLKLLIFNNTQDIERAQQPNNPGT